MAILYTAPLSSESSVDTKPKTLGLSLIYIKSTIIPIALTFFVLRDANITINKPQLNDGEEANTGKPKL
jgi:hypothetical protein